MRAIIQNHYGGIEMLKQVNLPQPKHKDNDVLIKIKATNIASADMKINTLDIPMILKPIMWLLFGFKGPRHKIRGISAAGTIIEIGKKVTKYKVGDSVYFINSMKAGCLAEFIALKETSIMVRKPDNISYEEAAPLAFGALSAYHFINDKTIQKGNEVLIYGASGSVGSYALQLAKYYGAIVTAVSSEKNHQKLMTLGADQCIDYHKIDFRTQSKQYDVIFDAVLKITKRSCKKVLKPKGKYLSVMMPTKESSERLEVINKIIEEGKLHSLIDRAFPFSQFKEAHERTYEGHKFGNVVIKV